MISVTIPLYNEKENISALYEGVSFVLESIGGPWELILVNDGSVDGCEEILDEIAQKDRSVKVIHLARNSGQAAAMKAGFDVASGDIIITMVGDLQNDPADIPKLLAKLEEGYDMCSGWRKDRKDNALTRIFPSVIANKLISLVSGIHLHDYGCMLKAYKKGILKGIGLYGGMHRFMPIFASWQGARIAEVIVTHHPRKYGKSKYGVFRTFNVIRDLIVIKYRELNGDKYISLPEGKSPYVIKETRNIERSACNRAARGKA